MTTSPFRLGLRILPADLRSVLIATAAGLAFGAYMAGADALLFRSVVPPAQSALVAATSAIERIALFALPAIVDELEFRLVVMTALVWLFVTVAGRRDG